MTVPFALSIHSFVNSVGSYVGFASIIAVAILILLYFAHARETATLRDRLEEAQQRISGLEGRIGQLLQLQQRGVRAPGPVAPAPAPVTPSPVRPAGAPQGSVRRVPNPATPAAVASAPAGLAQAALPRQTGVAAPAAPVGVGGPALASATRVIPDPAAAGAPDDTMFVRPGAAANGKGEGDQTAVLATGAPSAAVAAPPASASPRGGAGIPPRMQIGAEEPAPATPAAGKGKVRRIGGHPDPAPVSLPAFDDESVGGRFSGALIPIVVAVIAVAVIIVGLIVINNSNNSSTTGNVSHGGTSTATTGQTLHKKHTAAAPFNPAGVTVAVLNGTAQQGLAGKVGNKLAGDGYKKGNITNAASQTQGLTFVYFRAGKGAKLAAEHVAKALALPASRVKLAGATVIQSCAISATGASLGSCAAQVIVSVGQDRLSLATG